MLFATNSTILQYCTWDRQISLFVCKPQPSLGIHNLWSFTKYKTYFECMCAKSLQSCPTLCYTKNLRLPGSSVRGILQARILEWVAKPSSSESSQPSDWTHVSYVSWIGRRILYHWQHLGSRRMGSQCICWR